MSGSSGNPYFDMPGVNQAARPLLPRRLEARKAPDAESRRALGQGLQPYRRQRQFRRAGLTRNLRRLAARTPLFRMTTTRTLAAHRFRLRSHRRAKHILRGGYGLYYGNVFQNIPLFMIQQANPTIYQGVFSITSPTDIVPGTGIALGNWRYGVDPFPIIPPPLTALVPGATGRLMDPKYRNPVSQQFNFGYQWAATSPRWSKWSTYTSSACTRTKRSTSIRRSMAFAPCPRLSLRPEYQKLGRVMDEESINRSRYDGLNSAIASG